MVSTTTTNGAAIDWSDAGEVIAQAKTQGEMVVTAPTVTASATAPAKKPAKAAKGLKLTGKGKRRGAGGTTLPDGVTDNGWTVAILALTAACGTDDHRVALPAFDDADRQPAMKALLDTGFALPTTLLGKRAEGFTWMVDGKDNVGLKATRAAAKALNVPFVVAAPMKVPAKKTAAPATKKAAAKIDGAKKATTVAAPKKDGGAKKATTVPPAPAAPAPVMKAATGARAQAQANAEAGIIPAAPDFTAATHKPYLKKHAALVALVEAGDIAGLQAFSINPTSTSPKALIRYRDLAIIALKARADQEKADAKHAAQ